MSSCLRLRAVRESWAWLQGGPAAGEASEGRGWRSPEAERCNERRQLDLWDCARGSGLPARASTWEQKQVLARDGATGS
jgi:hypothetical protein